MAEGSKKNARKNLPPRAAKGYSEPPTAIARHQEAIKNEANKCAIASRNLKIGELLTM